MSGVAIKPRNSIYSKKEGIVDFPRRDMLALFAQRKRRKRRSRALQRVRVWIVEGVILVHGYALYAERNQRRCDVFR